MTEARNLPPQMADRLIVALDVPSVEQARALTAALDDVVSFYKIGMWLLFAAGTDRFMDELIARGKKIFLDYKMYDIGETVKQGMARATARGVKFVTVHGDPEIMRAAVEGRGDSTFTQILAITALTSLDDAGLHAMGYRMGARELVELRVRSAVACGVDGIIAAPQDKPDEIRAFAGQERLLVVTPGIRPAGSTADDHKRQATPGQAIAAGADYLVVGRPITQAADPAAAARAIIAEMQAAL